MKKSRIAGLRAPFVATVLVGGVSLVGCELPSVDGNRTNPPEVLSEECPTQKPTAGEPCLEGLSCEYEWCGDSHPTFEATCGASGEWEIIQTSCNPPYLPMDPDAGTGADGGSESDGGSGG